MASQTSEPGGTAAADTMGEKHNVTDKLHDMADYVRNTDAEDMRRDVMRAARTHPMTSVLVLSAVVIGGGMLIAAMLRNDGSADASGSRRPMRFTTAFSGLGPRGTETLSRIRDAAFSFAVDKAVDTVDGMFPGFREHYERG